MTARNIVYILHRPTEMAKFDKFQISKKKNHHKNRNRNTLTYVYSSSERDIK